MKEIAKAFHRTLKTWAMNAPGWQSDVISHYIELTMCQTDAMVNRPVPAVSGQQEQMTRERIMQIVRYSTVGSKAVPESEWVAFARAIEHELRAAQQVQADARGEVVVTWDEGRTRILAVTRQDDDGQILSIIAEAPAQVQADAGAVAPTDAETIAEMTNRVPWWNHTGRSRESAVRLALEAYRHLVAMSREQSGGDHG